MKSRWVLVMQAVVIVAALNGCINSNKGGSSNTGFMWVATQGDQMVSSFTINLTTGAASQVGKTVPTGISPVAAAITPDSKTLFIANSGDNTLSAYTVNSDGSLTAQGTPVKAGEMPMGMAVDPNGAFLFVASQGNFADPISGTVSVFSIQSAGLAPANAVTITSVVLTSNVATVTAANTFVPGEIVRLEGLTTSTYLNNQTVAVSSATATQFTFNFTHANDTLHLDSGTAAQVFLTGASSGTGTGPVAIAVPSSGLFVYVANQFNGTVSGFAYDNKGLLTQLPNSPYPVNTNPSGLAFSRSVAVNPTARDNFLFVANSGSNDISIFNACVATSLTCANTTGSTPTGLLTPVGSAVAAGVGPNSFVVDPAADFVYAVDEKSNQISEYKYSPATGALTALSPPAASTGSNPISAGVTHDGNWVFAANNGGSNLSAFQIGTAGKLNLPTTPSIALSNQPSVVLVK